jgi:hypothetical protein
MPCQTFLDSCVRTRAAARIGSDAEAAERRFGFGGTSKRPPTGSDVFKPDSESHFFDDVSRLFQLWVNYHADFLIDEFSVPSYPAKSPNLRYLSFS